MPDIADEGRMREELFLNLALDKQRRKTKPSGKKSRRNCVDCGEIIPRARKLAVPGVERCVECQGDYERQG